MSSTAREKGNGQARRLGGFGAGAMGMRQVTAAGKCSGLFCCSNVLSRLSSRKAKPTPSQAGEGKGKIAGDVGFGGAWGRGGIDDAETVGAETALMPASFIFSSSLRKRAACVESASACCTRWAFIEGVGLLFLLLEIGGEELFMLQSDFVLIADATDHLVVSF